jgi:hypothetical protein
MVAKHVRLYQRLEEKLGKKGATEIIDILDEGLDLVKKTAESLCLQKKLEVKDELSKELASKGDLKATEAALTGDIKSMKAEMRISFIVLLCVVVLLNRDSLELIGKLLGLIK